MNRFVRFASSSISKNRRSPLAPVPPVKVSGQLLLMSRGVRVPPTLAATEIPDSGSLANVSARVASVISASLRVFRADKDPPPLDDITSARAPSRVVEDRAVVGVRVTSVEGTRYLSDRVYVSKVVLEVWRRAVTPAVRVIVTTVRYRSLPEEKLVCLVNPTKGQSFTNVPSAAYSRIEILVRGVSVGTSTYTVPAGPPRDVVVKVSVKVGAVAPRLKAS